MKDAWNHLKSALTSTDPMVLYIITRSGSNDMNERRSYRLRRQNDSYLQTHHFSVLAMFHYSTLCLSNEQATKAYSNMYLKRLCGPQP